MIQKLKGMTMGQTPVSPLQEALEIVESLSPDDQETLIELIHHRLTEQRRGEIAQNAAATLKAVGEGRVQFGSLEDLKGDLLAEP